jgi:hypothetical protein
VLAGRTVEHLLLRGASHRPRTVLPLASADALQHFLRSLVGTGSAVARARNRALETFSRLPVPAHALFPGRTTLTLVRAKHEPPLRPVLLQAAESLGVRPGGSWVLSLGTGDDLQRAVFHVLERQRPAWVVKFTRVPGFDASFLRDAVGLELARLAGGAAAAHAPGYLGQLTTHGLTASVETAAVGTQLLRLLPGRPLRLLADIADWTTRMGLETRRPAADLAPERARLRAMTAAERGLSLPADLVDRVPSLPAVLQHNDLGSWNIISDGRAFTAVDWESAQAAGLPLWDLLYFAADVLPRLDGPGDVDTLLARTLQIFAGESRHSPLLFGWVRAAASALSIPPSAWGPIAALCWLHHGQSASLREEALGEAAPATPGHLARLAAAWLARPELGADWPALRP